MCVNYPSRHRVQPPGDVLDVCECARQCENDPECKAMVFQQRLDDASLSQCYAYSTECEEGKYPGRDRWCIAAAKFEEAGPLGKDGGWTLVGLLVAGLVIYLAIGVAVGHRSGTLAHPHRARWMALISLVVDGIAFTRAGFRNEQANSHGGVAAPSSSDLRGSLLPRAVRVAATRGHTTTIHAAAAMGDAVRLQEALHSDACVTAGDKRQYTAFHIACAGGHVACARLLLEARCDPTLLNDAGRTGWQLAESLHRTEVLALQHSTLVGSSRALRKKHGDKSKNQRNETTANRASALIDPAFDSGTSRPKSAASGRTLRDGSGLNAANESTSAGQGLGANRKVVL